jgi:oligopeptide/dipeptide ABC transporter ATP-binding protein
MPLLDIDNLQTHLHLRDGTARVVDGISLHVDRGKTLAVVGESGCGKSMTAYSILRLVPSPPGIIAGGRILFNGVDLLQLSEREIRSVRGNTISMVFQEPQTALNPVFRVGSQVAEVLQVHRAMSRRDALERVVQLFQDVGIPSPGHRIQDYPHQMSGGMRQRVVIATAMACEPHLIIADEPTTALDVTVQAQIMDLLRGVQESRHMAMLLITHDLGIVAESADTVAVMYAGRILEYADVRTLFRNPLNPYTRGLLGSLPHFGRGRLKPIRGIVPSMLDVASGCRFSTRCDQVMDRCRVSEPELAAAQDQGHLVRCWLYQR